VVCVCFLGRQGPPRPARRRTSGGETRFLCFSPHKRTRAHGPPRQVAERGANKPQTHTQRAAHSTLRSRVRRVPARASAPPRRGAREQRGAQRGEERKTENTRGLRTATKESGLPVAPPHAACATPRAACVARPLVARAPRPPAVSGSGAKGAGARAEQGEAQDGRFDCEHGPRAPRARGARTPHAPRASRRALRAPRARAWCARPRRAAERGRGARETTQRDSRATTKRPTGVRNTDRELRGRSAFGLPTRRARRVARRVRRAPARDARAPAGVRVDRGSAARGATEREKRGEEHHTRDVPARLRRREPPATHARHAHRARVARRDARWRGPVPHEATTKEKARDKDHDRRQKKKRSTTARPCSTAAARTTHTCAARRRRACASASPRPSRSTRRRAKAARRVSVRAVTCRVADDKQPILKQQPPSRHACIRTARRQFADRSRVPRSTDLTSERFPPSRAAG
jgi:hypothetical protein